MPPRLVTNITKEIEGFYQDPNTVNVHTAFNEQVVENNGRGPNKTQKVKTVTFSVVLREFEDDTEEEILKEYERIRKLVGRQWNQELKKLKYESAVQWKGMRLEIETSKGRYKRILVEL